jgi:FkbM family methyltransferase
VDSEIEMNRLWEMPRGGVQKTSLVDPGICFTDGPSVVSQFRAIFVRECYAFASSSDRPIIVDLGANIGLGVIWWKHQWPESRVVAFEPDPEIFALLAENTRYLKGVDLRQLAVSGTAGGLSFVPDGADGGRLAEESSARSFRVDAVTLGDVLRAEEAVDLLKIDIEGAEHDVLLEAQSELFRVAHLFVEYHSFANQPQKLDELLSLLSRAGYRYYIETLDERYRPFTPQKGPTGMDLQCDIYAWRE